MPLLFLGAREARNTNIFLFLLFSNFYDGPSYRQPFLYWHSIQRQNSLKWQFDCREIFAKEVTISHKLCKNIVFNTLKKHMFRIFDTIATNKYPKHMFCEEIRTKQDFYNISISSLRYSVQQQIHFNGNVFGNKCCRCNEGSSYHWIWTSILLQTEVFAKKKKKKKKKKNHKHHMQLWPVFSMLKI